MFQCFIILLLVISIFTYNKSVNKYYNEHPDTYDLCNKCNRSSLSSTPRPWWIRLHERIRT